MKAEIVSIHELGESACLRLLEEHIPRVGRIAFADEQELTILPVNYRMVDGQVVFRTDSGAALDALAGGGRASVAFEVDALDPGWREGWSVLVRGTVVRVTDEALLERLRRLPLRPWAPGDRDTYLRIEPHRLTGRRIS